MHTCVHFVPGAQPYELYVALRTQGPQTGLQLAQRVGTTCVSTVASEARQCLRERGMGDVTARPLSPQEKAARGIARSRHAYEYSYTDDPQARTPHDRTPQTA